MLWSSPNLTIDAISEAVKKVTPHYVVAIPIKERNTPLVPVLPGSFIASSNGSARPEPLQRFSAHASKCRTGSDATGQEIPREDWMSRLIAGGLSESYAQLVAGMYDAHNAGRIEVEPGGEIRRGSTPLIDGLAQIFVRRLRDGQAKLTLSTGPLCPQ
jgi:hypothetical protein